MGLLAKSVEYLMAYHDGEGAGHSAPHKQPDHHTEQGDNSTAPDNDRVDSSQQQNHTNNANHTTENNIAATALSSADTDKSIATYHGTEKSRHAQQTEPAVENATPVEQKIEPDRATEPNQTNEPVNTAHAVRTKRYKSASIASGAMLSKLQKISIFETIKNDLESLHEIIDITKSVRIGENLPVIEEGSIGNEMFIVYSGAVEIKKLTRAGDTYTVVKLSQAQNIFFGELALIDNDRRSATVTTLVDSTFLVINSKDFHQLGKRAPHIVLPIVQSIAKILSKRLRKTTADMLTIFDALVQEISET